MESATVALIIYAVLFTGFAAVVGRMLKRHGGVLLADSFGDDSPVGKSVSFLLDLGFYLLCLGLVLWNVGSPPTGQWRPDPDNPQQSMNVFAPEDVFYSVAMRLGVSIFVVAVFHSLNILVVSILSRKRT